MPNKKQVAGASQWLAIFACFALAMIGSSTAIAENRYGSIVFSQESGGGYAMGMAWSYDSRSKARNRAIRECQSRGGTSCREVNWFRNACGAIAIGGNNGFGTSWGDSLRAAENKAISECRRSNQSCRISMSRCAQ